MANVKERKNFSLSNFRGLDKENKPLKVAPFRAVDGENFIIDSETLKTRPGFKYFNTPINLEDNEIIDFYNFRGLYVYVTKKGFYFKSDETIINESTNPKLITNVTFNYDFVGLRPYFQEEQEVLFIFCMDDIFVLSNLYNQTNGVLENVVFYSISNKPSNPFTVDNSYYQDFVDLPVPYEPTLFIGDNALDDVNLLSNVSKYKLFANTSLNSQEGVNTYYLPTHYDEAKHGYNPKVEVSFYKNRFKSLEIYPIFLGKEGENFDSLNTYGVVINQDNPIILQEDYIAKEVFEYKGDRDSETPPTPIKEILGLTKEDFFDLKIKGNTQRVFEYILDYIKINYPDNDIESNKILKFILPYQRTSNYRNETSNEIEKVYKEQREETIYIQLKRFNDNDVSFVNKVSKEGVSVNEPASSESFPSYPTMDVVPDVGLTFDITPSPVEKAGFTINDFVSMANTWLDQNKLDEDFINGSKVKLLGKLFESKSETTGASVSGFDYWYISDVSQDIEWNVPSTFPDFPDFNNDSGNDPLDLGIFSKSGQNTFFLDFKDKVRSAILAQVNSLSSDENYGYAKFRWQTYWDDGQGYFEDKGQSCVVRFYYTKEITYNYEKRNSFAMTLTVAKDKTNIVDDLYDVTFDNSMGSFVLKCKDYFYDFNGEPSIDVKITFKKNTDYDIIAKSKFGITFGSENRLFLAGNEKTPHIDRFNVSNDLLGNNIKNQSYELSYFPSKNYRVLGGKGAINGYVLATDTQLYITKEEYPNDEKLFIRNRTMDDNGLVGYNEFKTSIDRTPLNERSIVRFYNDILLLDKKGLYGLEISSNVLTNERLVKMRGGFINKELTNKISSYDNDKIFIFEDNNTMIIFIGKNLYIADSRYLAQNPNAEKDNYNYEIVKWEVPIGFKVAKKINDKIYLLDDIGKNIYVIEDDLGKDVIGSNIDDILYPNRDGIYNGSIFTPSGFNLDEDNYKEITFKLNEEIKYVIAKEKSPYGTEDNYTNYTIENDKIIVINDYLFKDINDGDKIYLDINGSEKEIIVNGFELSGRNIIDIGEDVSDLSPYHYEGTFIGDDLLQNDFDNLIVDFEDLQDGGFKETKLRGSYFVCSAESAFYFNPYYHWSASAGGGTSAITYTWSAPYDLNGLTEINMKAGDIISILDFSYDVVSNTISTLIKIISYNSNNLIYRKYDGILYIDSWIYDGDTTYLSLSPYNKNINKIFKMDSESNQEFINRVNETFYNNSDNHFIFESEVYFFSGNLLNNKNIKLRWVSSLLDFGNNIFEKTIFKTLIYGTKQKKENKLFLGYRTMRKGENFDNPKIRQDFSNAFDFENVDFNLFAINTLNEFGSSIQSKENNFLYIQFIVYGDGNIELNSLSFIYKNNRMLKSIG